MSAPKCVGGKWGPIAYAVAPVINEQTLRDAEEDLHRNAVTLSRAVCDKFDQWERSKNENTALQDSLWDEYRELFREYNVLIGWNLLVRAALVFAQDGCQSQYLAGVTEIGVEEMPPSTGTYSYGSCPPGCTH